MLQCIKKKSWPLKAYMFWNWIIYSSQAETGHSVYIGEQASFLYRRPSLPTVFLASSPMLSCVLSFKAWPWFLASRDRVAMGTMALCVPEGTKGDFHSRTSEQARIPVGKWLVTSILNVIGKIPLIVYISSYQQMLLTVLVITTTGGHMLGHTPGLGDNKPGLTRLGRITRQKK